MTRPFFTAAGMAALVLAGSQAAAQSVTMSGSMGNRAALLVIDGKPRTLAVGTTAHGVRLLSVSSTGAEVEIAGKRLELAIGSAPVSAGNAPPGGTEIVLTAGPGGHFITAGAINGKQVSFMVDTGATTVALSESDAQRIGLDYRTAPRVMTHTANGTVPAYMVMLSSVRIGNVEIANVQALVTPAVMTHALLGNSFLSRFQMRRENDVMRLEKR